MSDYDDLLQKLKTKRDELRVQMHLASRDASKEWDELEGKYKKFSRDAELGKSGEGVSDALRSLGDELKQGYQRLHRAVKK